MPTPAINLGSAAPGLAVRMYQRKHRANLGPAQISQQMPPIMFLFDRTGSHGNEDLENRALRVAVADCRGH